MILQVCLGTIQNQEERHWQGLTVQSGMQQLMIKWLQLLPTKRTQLFQGRKTSVFCQHGSDCVPRKNAIGQIEKRKARWVCQGCRQLPGVDYFEISSSVVRMSTARTLFAIAAMLDWDIQQININNAFLLGDLDEEIYVEQPEGYEQGDPAEYLCKLNEKEFIRFETGTFRLGSYCDTQTE